jgi:hypothetical protein
VVLTEGVWERSGPWREEVRGEGCNIRNRERLKFVSSPNIFRAIKLQDEMHMTCSTHRVINVYKILEAHSEREETTCEI